MARLLASALLLLASSGALAQEAYSGPNEDTTRRWTVASSGSCPGTTPSTSTQMDDATIIACAAEWQSIHSSGVPLASHYWVRGTTCGSTNLGPLTAAPTGPAANGVLGVCWVSGAGAWGTEVNNCPSNRSLATISGVARCVSRCYSLRGTSVSAFVPISDPAQSVPGACLFLAGTGTCEIEATDTSNYTYGSQLYRGGTWIHVGQQCVEDTSSAPSDGAINTSPTGGTGGGVSSEGDTTASKTAMLDAVATAQASIGDDLDNRKEVIEKGDRPLFLDEGQERWLPSLASFLPVEASCTLDGGTVAFGGASVHLEMSFCEWGGRVKDFLGFAIALFTMWAVWSSIFVARGT